MADWDYICKEFEKEIVLVGSIAFSEHHLLSFLHNLCKSPQTNGTDDILLQEQIEGLPIHDAVREKLPKVDVIKLMETCLKADPQFLQRTDDTGQTVLHLLASSMPEQKDYTDLIRYAIQRDANINAKDRQGWTPLHCACYYGNLSAALLLLEKNANVMTLTKDGTLPITYLVRNTFGEESKKQLQIKVLESLLKSGVDIDATNNNGDTPLHQVMFYKTFSPNTSVDGEELDDGSVAIVTYLLDRGANVSAKNNHGETPLHVAARAGRRAVSVLLVQRGADPHAIGMHGTPAEVAKQYQYNEIHNFLVNMPSPGVPKASTPPPSDSLFSKFFRRNRSMSLTEGLKAKDTNSDDSDNNMPNELTYSIQKPKPTAKPTLIQLNNKKTPYQQPHSAPVTSQITITSNNDERDNLVACLAGAKFVQLTDGPIMEPPTSPTEIPIPSTPPSPSPPSSPVSSSLSSYTSLSWSPKMESCIHPQYMHSFKNVHFNKPTWCLYCQGFIWGVMVRQGYICEYCDYTVHPGCKAAALAQTCTKRLLADPRRRRVRKPIGDIFDDQDEDDEERRMPTSKVLKLLGPNVRDLDKEPALAQTLQNQYSEWLTQKEFDALYKQFKSMDTSQSGHINQTDFTHGIGTILNDNVLANSLFRVLDGDKDGKLDLREYMNGMITLMKGSKRQQFEFAFQLFTPTEEGYITRESFERLIESMKNSLGSLLMNIADIVATVFDSVDIEHKSTISLEQYIDAISNNKLYVQSLGLLKLQESQNQEADKQITKRSGFPIIFGHENWDMTFYMFFGIRLSVAEVYSNMLKNPRVPTAKDFELVVEYEMKNIVSRSPDQWIFKDYGGPAFYHLRNLYNIDHKNYMFSLGPEKILGNLLLGKLQSLCEMVSTGRSGSFFFKTNDGKYLIKTLPPEEHALLHQILPNYYEFVKNHPNTLLTRFFGLHSLKKGSDKELHFVVMANLFDSLIPIHEQYDLKGSVVGRHVENDARNPNIALKDNDFNRRIKLGPKLKAELLEQIEADVKFMEQFGICDYSFLVGFHFVDARRGDFSILMNESKKSTPPRSIFNMDLGGVFAQDKSEVYFIGIIDNLTVWDYKKAGEHMAKSLFHNANQLSAIRPAAYRVRFQKYLASIVD